MKDGLTRPTRLLIGNRCGKASIGIINCFDDGIVCNFALFHLNNDQFCFSGNTDDLFYTRDLL